MRVTIKKIAEVAKVSRGTVDKVLNNRPGVSKEVHDRVEKIVIALEYKPNMLAKALSNQKRPIVIAVIIPPNENPYYDEILNGINKACEELSDFAIKINIEVMKSINEEEQSIVIDSLVSKNVSAIALVPIDCDLIRKTIDNAVDKNIPVITFISDLINSKRLCFIGHDLINGGRVAGELMGKLLDGVGNIAILTGSTNILAHNQRIEGFKSVLFDRFKNLEVVEILEDKDNDIISFEKTLLLVEKFENLSGIFITGGGVAGVGKALKIAKVDKRIRVISFDLVPETIKLVKEGIIDFTIGQDPFFQGYKLIKVISDYLLSGKNPDNEKFLTKVDIRVRENID